MAMDIEAPNSVAENIAQNRDKSRESIFLGAVLVVDGDSTRISVRVRNISSGGMMVDLPGPQKTGTKVQAEIKGLGSIGGHIAWSTENRTGISFDRPVDPKLTRQVSPTVEAPLYKKSDIDYSRRPGLSVR